MPQSCTPIPAISARDAKRFWSNVLKSNGCWAYTGDHYRSGYGRIYIEGKRLLTHRVAYTLAVGEIPAGLLVLHDCDNPPCCRPDHLFLGTNQDNMQDAVNKGRFPNRHGLDPFRNCPNQRACGARSGPTLHPEFYRGEMNGRAKLTEQDVLEIRCFASLHGFTPQELAPMYGVTDTAIRWILSRRTWRHI